MSFQKGGAGLFYPDGRILNTNSNEMTQFLLRIIADENTRIISLKNDSLSGVILILQISENFGIRTLDETTIEAGRLAYRPVTRLLVKLVALHPTKIVKNYGFKTNEQGRPSRNKQADNEDHFKREFQYHNYIFNKSFSAGYPICPAIMCTRILKKSFKNNPIYNILSILENKTDDLRFIDILQRFKNAIEGYNNNVYRYNVYKKYRAGNPLQERKLRLGLMCMEFAENYETLADLHYKKKLVINNVVKSELVRRFYILYNLGFIHNDDHPGNMMFKMNGAELQYIYLIDFGRTRRRREDISFIDYLKFTRISKLFSNQQEILDLLGEHFIARYSAENIRNEEDAIPNLHIHDGNEYILLTTPETISMSHIPTIQKDDVPMGEHDASIIAVPVPPPPIDGAAAGGAGEGGAAAGGAGEGGAAAGGAGVRENISNIGTNITGVFSRLASRASAILANKKENPEEIREEKQIGKGKRIRNTKKHRNTKKKYNTKKYLKKFNL
jgi:serine/threonine protein kinase